MQQQALCSKSETCNVPACMHSCGWPACSCACLCAVQPCMAQLLPEEGVTLQRTSAFAPQEWLKTTLGKPFSPSVISTCSATPAEGRPGQSTNSTCNRSYPLRLKNLHALTLYVHCNSGQRVLMTLSPLDLPHAHRISPAARPPQWPPLPGQHPFVVADVSCSLSCHETAAMPWTCAASSGQASATRQTDWGLAHWDWSTIMNAGSQEVTGAGFLPALLERAAAEGARQHLHPRP